MAFAKNALYVVSARDSKDNGGVIYKLDQATLKTQAQTHTDLKKFAMATNNIVRIDLR